MNDWEDFIKQLKSNATIAPFTIVTDLEHDLTQVNTHPCITAISHFACLYVTGADALKFLQGQFSCDMQQLSSSRGLPGAYCNIQGRVIAVFLVISWQNGILLVMPEEIIATLAEILKKYAIFSKVTINDYRSQLDFIGLMNVIPDITLPQQNYEVREHENTLIVKLLGSNYLAIIPSSKSSLFFDNIKIKYTPVGSVAWHYQQLYQGFPNIYQATQQKLLPHRINLPQLGVINFKKGCYLGQEIIARTHYKAILKHGLYLYQITGDEYLKPGDSIDSVTGHENIGQVIDCCPTQEHAQLILASLLIDQRQVLSWQVKGKVYRVMIILTEATSNL